jgi:hypothetical protein
MSDKQQSKESPQTYKSPGVIWEQEQITPEKMP